MTDGAKPPTPAGSPATEVSGPHQGASLEKKPTPEPTLPKVGKHEYDVGEEFAHGGLGRIYRGIDRRLNREVALKVLRVRNERTEARFAREAFVTARLQHPGIVPVYEAGTWPDGEPFYAMKLVSGKPLSELIAERTTLAERLALLPNVIAMTEAMAYAHEKRIIHRDLKPANVMVGAFGETVVIDWGLAKDLDAPMSADSHGSDDGTGATWPLGMGETPATARLDPQNTTPVPPPLASPMPISGPKSGPHSPGETVAGTVLGTPAYMPPEQARGQRVDERADVYALGAVLYHLLRGAMPHGDLSPVEARRAVVSGTLVDVTQGVAGIPEDLVAITRKAMAHAVEKRYRSAKELAADLRRFETGQLVSVRTYLWYEVLGRWVQKNRAAVGVAAAALVALAALGVFSVRRVIDERNAALTASQAAEVARADAQRRSDELVLVQAATALDRDPTAALAWAKQHPGTGALPRLRTVAADAVARGVARHVLRGHDGRVTGLAYGAGPDQLITCALDGRLLAWDLKTGTSRTLLQIEGLLWALAAARDGKSFAIASSEKVRLVTPGSPERTFPSGSAAVLALELSPDGKRLAGGTVNGHVWVWDVESGKRTDLPDHTAEVRDLAFTPDSNTLVSASWDGTVQLHELATGKSRPIPAHAKEMWSIDISPDGKVLATSGADGYVRLWDLASGVRSAELESGPVTHVQFSPDGRRLAAASRDHSVRLWVAPFLEGRTLEGHTADVLRVQFSPDGQTLASAGSDTTVRLWSVDGPGVRVLSGHEAYVGALAFSSDGKTLASAGQDGSARVWSVAPVGARLDPALADVALSPAGAMRVGLAAGQLTATDGAGLTVTTPGKGWRWFGFATEERVVAQDENHDVVSWEPREGKRQTLGRVKVDIGSAVEASGWVAVGAYDGTICMWRLSDGEQRTWKAHPTYTLTLQATPDGSVIASAGEDGSIALWSVATGERQNLKGHTGPVHHMRFSRDGRLLASGDVNGELRLWQVSTATLLAEEKHAGFVRALAFSRDGSLLASGGDDKLVSVRELSNGETRQLKGPEQAVHDLAFSRDGELLAVASGDHTVRVFEQKTGAARVLRGHEAAVKRVVFAADGSLLSSDQDGVVRRWQRAELEPLPGNREALGRWLDAATTATIDADHRPATAQAGK